MTKFFVPRYRSTIPPMNAHLLSTMLCEVDEGDLPAIVNGWREMDELFVRDPKKYFSTGTKSFCKIEPIKHTFEAFLRRPHITLHGGSKPGAAFCADLMYDTTFKTGQGVVQHGFNLWTGGGGGEDDRSQMGAMTNGALNWFSANDRRSDQYIVHVIPAGFAFPFVGKIGPRPANEGLSKTADAVIIMPDFDSRRTLLDARCAAAITGFGGTGTNDETTDVLVHLKTGERLVELFLLNIYVPEIEQGYYDLLIKHIGIQAKCGMDATNIMDYIQVRSSPEEVFETLLPKLEARGQLPDQVYNNYMYELEAAKLVRNSKVTDGILATEEPAP